MKIIITGANGECLPPPFGGIIKCCLLQAKEWRELGAEVSIHIHHKHSLQQDLDSGATFFYDFQRPPGIWQKLWFLIQSFIRHPVLFYQLTKEGFRTNTPFPRITHFFSAAHGIVLHRFIKKNGADIILTECGAPQSLSALQIARHHQLPIILQHYAEIQYKEGSDGSNVASHYKKLWERLVNEVDLVVSSSEHCALGPRTYIRDPQKMKIIYSGIRYDIFQHAHKTDQKTLREAFSLPQEKFLLLAVGAMGMRKGHDQLFEALLRLPSQIMKKIAVVICGAGDISRMREAAHELNFPLESLFLLQGLSEQKLAQLYAAADGFCFPSITPRECMGLALKEALSTGLPIAAYDTGGIKEAVIHGINGFLAPSGDRQALAVAIQHLTELSPEAGELMKQKNRQRAEYLFDIKNTSRQFYQEFEKLIALYSSGNLARSRGKKRV